MSVLKVYIYTFSQLDISAALAGRPGLISTSLTSGLPSDKMKAKLSTYVYIPTSRTLHFLRRYSTRPETQVLEAIASYRPEKEESSHL